MGKQIEKTSLLINILLHHVQGSSSRSLTQNDVISFSEEKQLGHEKFIFCFSGTAAFVISPPLQKKFQE